MVLRGEILQGVQHLHGEIAASQRMMDKVKKQATAREGRIQRLKRELGFIDYCTTDSNPQPSCS